MKERWRRVAGFRKYYLVSNHGNVWSRRTKKFLSLIVTSRGYLQVNLSANRKRKCLLIHRLVALAFIGPQPEGHQVNHKDGNKRNNRVKNLEFVTHRQNMAHAKALGLFSKNGRRGRGIGKCRPQKGSVQRVLKQ